VKIDLANYSNYHMSKVILLFLLFMLVSCAPAPKPTPTSIPVPTPIPASSIHNLRQEYPPSIEAFDTSEKCPHICWLGINPGVTLAEEAHLLLRASNQIDQERFHASPDGIRIYWFTEKQKTDYVEIDISNVIGRVETITFSQLTPFTMNDLVNLFGEPDEISIRVDKPADAEYVSYMVYYTKKKTIMWIMPGSSTGPQPTDHYIQQLVLSTEFKTLPPSLLADYDNYRQPWLGYGHFENYLPGLATPVSDVPTP